MISSITESARSAGGNSARPEEIAAAATAKRYPFRRIKTYPRLEVAGNRPIFLPDCFPPIVTPICSALLRLNGARLAEELREGSPLSFLSLSSRPTGGVCRKRPQRTSRFRKACHPDHSGGTCCRAAYKNELPISPKRSVLPPNGRACPERSRRAPVAVVEDKPTAMMSGASRKTPEELCQDS